MELKEVTIIKLRKNIEEQLKLIKDNKKIHIEKDILEELLFYKTKIDDEDIKIPVWTGEFLQKIDLSEVSFENVSFISYIEEFMTKKEREKFLYYYKNIFKNKDYAFDFSKTNITIDFRKIYQKCINSTNLSGIDLSNSYGEYIENIIVSNLSNTNINIDFDNIINISNTNLSNNDFKDKEINFEEREETFLYNCNLSNTKVRINYNGYNLENAKDEYEYEEKETQRNTIANLMKKRFIDYCYINNKYILTKEEIEEQRRNNEYLDLVAKIEKQISEEIKRKM